MKPRKNGQSLRPGGVAGEGSGQAEGDEDAAGDVTLVAGPARVGAKRAGDAAREKGPDAVAGGAHAGEENAEGKDLHCDMAAHGIDELGNECKEEKGRLGIEHVDDDALAEDASETVVRCGSIGSRGERFLAAKALDAEKNEISGAKIFDDAERGGGGNQKSGEADGGCGGMDQSADTDAEGGNEAGVAALADAASDNVENSGAGDGE